jgi:resolvase-like protein
MYDNARLSKIVLVAKTDRRELARAIQSLGDGDTLLVTRLDRLARPIRDLLNTLDTVTKAGAGFCSLGDVWVDTTTPYERLMLTVRGLCRVRAGADPRPYRRRPQACHGERHPHGNG